ncbi:MAG: OsmC family protein [Pyrinomonadaceae bacterium]
MSHTKTHAEDCSNCGTGGAKIDKFTRTIEFAAELDGGQKKKLLEIADKCPVHRTLENESLIETRLAE